MWLFKKHKEGNDEELAAAYFASGNRSQMGQLFDRHVKTVYGVCLFYFKDRDAAQDAVMAIFEKLLVELRRHKVEHFKAWLGFVTRNYCISELRKNKPGRFVSEAYLDFEVKPADWDEEAIIAGVTDEVLLKYLQECLPLLKDKQRVCVELFYLKDYTYQQIETETGYTLNEVKSYIQNGKRNLKLIIEEKIKQDAA